MFDHRNHECFDVDSEQATQMADSNFELIEVLEGKLVDLKESWSRGFDLLKAYLGTIGSFIKKIEEDGPQIKDLKPELGVGNEIVAAEIKKLAEILNVEFAALITKITECLGKHVGILNDYKTNFKRMTIHDRLGFCLEHHINLNIAPKSLKGVETLYNLFTPIFNIPPSSEPACK